MAALKPEIAIRKLLLDNAGIASAIGTRIYPGFAEEDQAKPYAIIRRDTTEPDHHMLGVSGLKYVSVELYLYGETYNALTTLAEQFEAVLDGVNDRTTVTIGATSIEIARLWMVEQSDEEVTIQDGTGRKTYSVYQRYELHYQN
jgi:hypothetical protein